MPSCVFSEAARQNPCYQDTSNSQVEKAIKDWLKHAEDRMAAQRRRDEKTNEDGDE